MTWGVYMDDLSDRLTVALNSLLSGQEFSEIPDIAVYDDIRDQWNMGYREELESAFRDGNLGPRYTEIVDYPKNDIAVRPLTRFSAPDRLLYDAMVFDISAELDAFRNPSVYSYRWNHRARKPIFWKTSWTRMRREAKAELLRNWNYKVASLDVSSFYEHIDVAILSDDLNMVTTNELAVRRITDFLKKFQTINHAWGLPQGSDASGILANAYLAPVDEFLKRNNFPFFRYSDDIMIFDEGWNTLRDVIIEVNRIFRSKRLSMSAHKTGILEFPEVIQELLSAQKSSIDQAVKHGDPEAERDVRSFFDEVIDGDRVGASDLKFALNKLRVVGDDYAVGWCLKNLPYVAYASREIFAYFAECGYRQSTIQRGLEDFMQSQKSASYPYIEQRVLRYFVHQRIESEKIKSAAWGIMEDRNREEFPREFAVRYLGGMASASEAQLLRHKFESEASITMRRALLIALYESRKLSERYLREVWYSLPELRWTCNYLAGNPKIPTS
ncbi:MULTISPECIES: RNA-directed DNA polymerase [Streptomyces]|uniref:RNA-directed DNA polymerase n=1 Tax=Streptomyces TaxID=1883 RepID=UPI00240CE60D|nr:MULTISPECIES: RNA-directed DNA polymerase [Streptomyces]WFB87606.1 RNA-directed DNA polymerase [Streptomyces olivaceus]WGK47206.1 RNA-directed DNA polymerase [Streptomyces sp. B146]